MACTIDSSVFVAAFHHADAAHEEAAEFFNTLTAPPTPPLVLPIVVLLETLHTLHRNRCSMDPWVLAGPLLTGGIIILPTSENLLRWSTAMRRFTLATNDAFIAAVAWEHHATLVSLDRKLLRAYRAVGGIALLPKEYLRRTRGGRTAA